MAEVTYYVALPFVATDEGFAAGEPMGCSNPNDHGASRGYLPRRRVDEADETGCESKLHRATVKGKLHSRQRRIRENAGYGVGIEDFQTQISARRHDFRCACGLKIDGIARLFPRLDGALGSFASNLISIRNKAASELFGELSKADFIGFFDKNFAALVLVCRPGSVQIESVCLRS